MAKIKVTAVSYLNTVPLLYGIRHSEVMEAIDLQIAPPAQCAAALEKGETDLSLIPVAALLKLPRYEIVSNYCIGATAPVRTVVLLSNNKLKDIHTIYLDPESRTSVELVRILAKHYWKINPAFKPYSKGQAHLLAGEGCLLIGDKVFAQETRYTQRYDLAEQWIAFTGLPFVFAAWASTKTLPAAFIQSFNKALEFGTGHIAASLTEPPPCPHSTAIEYLSQNISYSLDDAKKNGLKKFHEFLMGGEA